MSMRFILLVLVAWPGFSQSAPVPLDDDSDCRCAGVLEAVAEDGTVRAFPLKDTNIEIEVTGGLAYARIQQVFYNDTNVNLEAKYTFPLPADAVVTDMRLVFDGHEVRSVVREKAEAQATYTAAVAAGRKTALLEKQTGQLFSTRVANFVPGEEVTIHLAMTFPLTLTRDEDALYELNFPTTFSRPYLPVIASPSDEADPYPTFSKAGTAATGGPFAADEIAFFQTAAPRVDAGNPHLLTFNIQLRGLDNAWVSSSTHALDQRVETDGTINLSLLGTYDQPNRDLTVYISPELGAVPDVSVVHSQAGAEVHGLVTLLPPAPSYVDDVRLPREVVFLIDTSGSMHGEPLIQAKAGLSECLDMLAPEDRFNIVRFSHEYSSLAESFLPAETARLDEARFFVDRLQSDGGTEMQQALAHVLNLPRDPDYLRLVVFLTDGAVGSELALQNLLQTQRGDTRLFTFGVGSAPNAYLMDKMAELGRGESFFLRPGEDIGLAMADFFHTVKQPVFTDVSVEWIRTDGQPAEQLLAFPGHLPDLYAKRPLQLVYRDDRVFEGTLLVHGRLGGNPVSYEFPIEKGTLRFHPGIDTLFGQAYVEERLEDWTAETDPQFRESIRDDIVEAALAYNLVTRFTSRVAVAHNFAKTNLAAMGAPLRVHVPNMEPEPAVYTSTASDDPGKLLIGAVMALLGFYLVVVDRRRTQI